PTHGTNPASSAGARGLRPSPLARTPRACACGPSSRGRSWTGRRPRDGPRELRRRGLALGARLASGARAWMASWAWGWGPAAGRTERGRPSGPPMGRRVARSRVVGGTLGVDRRDRGWVVLPLLRLHVPLLCLQLSAGVLPRRILRLPVPLVPFIPS